MLNHIKTLQYLTIGLLLAAGACSQNRGQSRHKRIVPEKTIEIPEVAVSPVPAPDTCNQELYDFMQMVIAEKQLDPNYGLKMEADSDCSLSGDDAAFLKTLLIEPKKEEEPDTSDWRTRAYTVTLKDYSKCLTKKDISTMLTQKNRFRGFKWDNSRLGFDLSNKENWYSFSIPLRSKNKAVMMIRSLCNGLCGSGETVVFEKKGRKWTSQTVSMWMH